MQQHEQEEPTRCGFDRVVNDELRQRALDPKTLAEANTLHIIDEPPSSVMRKPDGYDRNGVHALLQLVERGEANRDQIPPDHLAYYELEREVFAESLVVCGDPTADPPNLTPRQRNMAEYVKVVLAAPNAEAAEQAIREAIQHAREQQIYMPVFPRIDKIGRVSAWDFAKDWRGIFFDDMPQRRDDRTDAFAWAASLLSEAKEYPPVSQPPFSFWWERDNDAERGQFDLSLAWELDAPLSKPYIEITIWRVSIWIGWFDIDSVRFY